MFGKVEHESQTMIKIETKGLLLNGARNYELSE